MDVHLNSMSGFDLLKQYGSFNGKVIFVTAHSSHAIKAIKFGALDYLLKPLDPDKLKQAIEKFKKVPPVKPPVQRPRKVAHDLKLLFNPVRKKIAVATREGIEILLLEDINYMQASCKYTLIKCTSGRDITVSKPLTDFELLLKEGHFMRIHNSFLINLHKVERYVRSDGGCVIMEDGTQIAVSRSYKDKLIYYLKTL